MIKKIINIKDFLKCFIPLLIGIFIGTIFFVIRRQIDFYFIFITIGLIVSLGFVIYGFSAKKHKKRAKYFTFISMFIFMTSAAFIFNENFQIEHFFISLLTLTYLGAITHWAVAKIFGPMFFGRFFCGWGCWTAAAFEIFPLKDKNKETNSKFNNLRYIMLLISIIISLIAVSYFGYQPIINPKGNDEIIWFIIGSSSYYIIGLFLMYKLKDRRAFCKYICPVSLVQKIFSRFSLLKVTGDIDKCSDCKVCEMKCPMDVKITEYIKNNKRVLSTECILCNECVLNCPENLLRLSIKVDF